MKFGKEFRIHLEETLPEWRDKFLNYKPLKKLLKNLPPSVDFAEDAPHPPPLDLQDWFVRILNEELEKFNDFYVDKEEEFVIRFQVNLNPRLLANLGFDIFDWVDDFADPYSSLESN